jgi:hypothetical protein
MNGPLVQAVAQLYSYELCNSNPLQIKVEA